MILLAILLPFLGTTLGSLSSFTLSNKVTNKIEKYLLAIAAGVMVAASIWSLLIPSIEYSSGLGMLAFLPASIGFFIGFLLFALIDMIKPKIIKKSDKLSRLIFAVTIHNIPEGMAVGVAVAAAYYGNVALTITSAMLLSIGISIQNIPEGAIISLPLRSHGLTKCRSFIVGLLTGIVEPIFSIITICLIKYMSIALPYLLAFAAGCMIYVVIDELLVESQANNKSLANLFFAIGFLIMMILDVVLK
ncbi:MAG: ZIP family metal transporter [Anaeroplasma sp.]